MDFSQRITDLHLIDDRYIIVGSGVLQALGIRETEDVDLLVTQADYDRLVAAGWPVDDSDQEPVIRHEQYDIAARWEGKTVDELLEETIVIDGLRYLHPLALLRWKIANAREKDQDDIAALQAFLGLT